PFYNTSEYSLGTLGSTKTRRNLEDYIALFSDNARAIFEEFEFGNTVIVRCYLATGDIQLFHYDH
ncbi:hypothetical protein EWM60_11880, partial [Candidatus Erwinia dacicola]|nr:hypothetical protein [Candidatus Erwinia dacicola]